MRRLRRRQYDMPGLNTAALPDLIFTVLFFFMIVTHMRTDEMKVEYKVPQGERLERLAHKASVCHIYIGKPIGAPDDSVRIQLNNRLATVEEIAAFVRAERNRMSPEDAERMTVSIKADRDTPMGVINDVKRALRDVHALNINYSGVGKEDKKEERGERREERE